jgi:hypothetical protein
MYGVRQQPNNRVEADLLRLLLQCEVFWKPLNTNVIGCDDRFGVRFTGAGARSAKLR